MDGFKIHEFVAHATEVNCLAFGPKSHQVLATGGEDTKVNVWRVGSASNLWTLGQNKSPIESVCFDAEEQYVVSGARNGSIKVFDLNAGRLARNLGGHHVNASTLQYHPYGEFIVSGSSDSTVKVWDVRNKACIQTYTGHSKEVTCVRFSPDGRWVASSSKDGKLLVWDLVADKLLSTIKADAAAYVQSFEFNPAELVVAAVTSARTVRLWDLETFEALRHTPPDSNPIKAMAISPDGDLLYTATKDALRAFNWNPAAKLKGTVDIGWDKVVELRVSPDGVLTAGSCISNFVSVWSVDLTCLAAAAAPDQKRGSPSRSSTHADAKRSLGLSSPPDVKDGGGGQRRVDLPPRVQPPYATELPEALRVGMGRSVASDPLPRSEEKGSSSNAARASPLQRPPLTAKDDRDDDRKQSPGVRSAGPSRPASADPRRGWGSEDVKRDMATSMGDSFRRRFEEEQRGLSARRAESKAAPDGIEEAEEVEEDNGGDDDGDAGVRAAARGVRHMGTVGPGTSLEAEDMARLLPPARYTGGAAGRPSDASPSRAGARGSPARARDREQKPAQSPSDGGSPTVTRGPVPPLRAVPLPLVSSMEVVGIGKNGPVADARPAARPDSRGRVAGGGSGRDEAAMRAAAKRVAMTAGGAGSMGGGGPGAGPGGRGSPGGLVRGLALASTPNLRADAASPPAAPAAAPATNTAARGADAKGTSDDGDGVEALLDRLLGSSGAVAVGLSQRLTSLRLLKKLWAKGDLTDVIDFVQTVSRGAAHDSTQLILLADFFSSVELRGAGAAFTLDACVGFMVALDGIVTANERGASGLMTASAGASAAGAHVLNACCKAFAELCEGFGELIRATRALSVGHRGSLSPVRPAIDLSREERVRKCNACHAVLERLKGRLDGMRQHAQRRGDLRLIQRIDHLKTHVDVVVPF